MDRANPNTNDITALATGDLFFDRFFGELAKPANHGNHTYWIRQNWGTPTLTLSQELRLPAGAYTLTADLWKSGLGGDAFVSVITEGGATVKSESLENKNAWQQVTLDFESDGEASTTIRLEAVHTSDGSEKIIGWDNISLTLKQGDAVKGLGSDSRSEAVYDLGGREVNDLTSQRGILIRNNKKVLVQKK